MRRLEVRPSDINCRTSFDDGSISSPIRSSQITTEAVVQPAPENDALLVSPTSRQSQTDDFDIITEQMNFNRERGKTELGKTDNVTPVPD